MKRQKYLIAGGLILGLLLIGIVSLSAADLDNTGAAIVRTRIARLLGAGKFIRELNITADQKAEIKNILVGDKIQIRKAVRDVVKARLDIANDVPGAANELAVAQMQAIHLRRQIFEQIKPVLTPDQLSKVQDVQQLRKQRLQKLLDKLNSKLGE